MTIIVAEKITRAPAGEWAPPVPRAIREALRSNSDALALWIEAQSKPAGWSMGTRERMADAMGWTRYRIRRAIGGLRAAGLYLVDRVQDAGGRWSTACRFVANLPSLQVGPKAGLPDAGIPAAIPLSTESKRAAPHLPATCLREAAGLPCRDCAKYVAAQRIWKWPAAPATSPAARPVGDVLAAERRPARDVAARVECEHGRRRVACLACVLAG